MFTFSEANPLESIGDLTIHARNEDDPFITLKDDVSSPLNTILIALDKRLGYMI